MGKIGIKDLRDLSKARAKNNPDLTAMLEEIKAGKAIELPSCQLTPDQNEAVFKTWTSRNPYGVLKGNFLQLNLSRQCSEIPLGGRKEVAIRFETSRDEHNPNCVQYNQSVITITGSTKIGCGMSTNLEQYKTFSTFTCEPKDLHPVIADATSTRTDLKNTLLNSAPTNCPTDTPQNLASPTNPPETKTDPTTLSILQEAEGKEWERGYPCYPIVKGRLGEEWVGEVNEAIECDIASTLITRANGKSVQTRGLRSTTSHLSYELRVDGLYTKEGNKPVLAFDPTITEIVVILTTKKPDTTPAPTEQKQISTPTLSISNGTLDNTSKSTLNRWLASRRNYTLCLHHADITRPVDSFVISDRPKAALTFDGRQEMAWIITAPDGERYNLKNYQSITLNPPSETAETAPQTITTKVPLDHDGNITTAEAINELKRIVKDPAFRPITLKGNFRNLAFQDTLDSLLINPGDNVSILPNSIKINYLTYHFWYCLYFTYTYQRPSQKASQTTPPSPVPDQTPKPQIENTNTIEAEIDFDASHPHLITGSFQNKLLKGIDFFAGGQMILKKIGPDGHTTKEQIIEIPTGGLDRGEFTLHDIYIAEYIIYKVVRDKQGNVIWDSIHSATPKMLTMAHWSEFTHIEFKPSRVS